MKSANPKFFFVFLLLGTLLLPFHAYAVEENSWTEQQKADLNDIKTRLATLAEQQKEILAKEDRILEELDRVRIWVHRK